MRYFAEFKRQGEGRCFRLDTRIYLRDQDGPAIGGKCVAAIVGKNPGSAKAGSQEPAGLAEIVLDGDKMLPYVGKRFVAGYKLAGKGTPEGAFVRVWNLFYLCGADLKQAIKAFGACPPAERLRCWSESELPRIVWFAWGGPGRFLDAEKGRFLAAAIEKPFFYDWERERIVALKPRMDDFAKHPQGMPGAPVEEHLASIL